MRWACPYCKDDNKGRLFGGEELQRHYNACARVPKPPAPPPRPGFEPPDGHEALDLEARMPALGAQLARALPPQIGFMLVIIETGVPNARVSYISNVERSDGAKAMRQLLGKWGAL